MKGKHKYTWFVIGVSLLVLFFGWIYSMRLGNVLRFYDEQYYFTFVKNFLVTHTFTYDGIHSTALRPPGYPFLLSIMGALGADLLIQRMLNFLELATSIIVFYLWLKEQKDALTGAIGVGLLVCYPVLFYTAGTFFPQTLGALFFLLTLYIISKKPIRLWQAVLAGIVFGVLILTIPIFAFGILLLGLWLVWTKRGWHSATLFVLSACLVMGLWTWRNYRVFRSFVFIATDSGFNFLIGNAPDTKPNSGTTIDFMKYIRQANGLNEVQADAFFLTKAEQFILNDKAHAIGLYFLKVLNYFNFRNNMLTQGESSSLSDIVMLLGYGAFILILFIRIVCFKLFRFSNMEFFLLLFYLLSAFVYAVFFTRIRFRLPFDYLLIAVDAIFLRNVYTRWFEYRHAGNPQ